MMREIQRDRLGRKSARGEGLRAADELAARRFARFEGRGKSIDGLISLKR
jgi:hypothetical protein